MDSPDEDERARLHQNQPYDESLEVPDAEEIASTYSPTPRVANPPDQGRSRGDSPPQGGLTDDDSGDDPYEDDKKVKQMKPTPLMRNDLPRKPPTQTKQFNSEEEDDDQSEESDDDDDDDDDEDRAQVEGAYDPAEFENLSVSAEIKELFQYITRYTPQSIELEHKLKPFIPDFIPSVGDIDAFVKIPRPDNKPDTLGLTVLDEPCAKQSDPTVLDLQLRAISKQTTAKALVVKRLEKAEKNPKAIESWIESIRNLHRSKPPPNVHYSRNMPDVETLMQEWPPEFEDLLKEVSLPTAELDCDLAQFTEIICSILDIPIYKGLSHHNEKIQALHVLFTLYSEFKNSQHFQALAANNQIDNALKMNGTGDFSVSGHMM
ncbi:LOW QUALITY PROTEIN: intraflagellar transport protein 46 homolog [Pomacea canaliculata]|uniref:LOW QUALITY PROTEIN: intraflagellar transport protein 46 homolog n=1 Tax=Pomacea canaliculata TaxID=400727 RepID=UPI000D72B098|nr:LOW QUALITY PROTEIN: intraflagellar transport protein 46 homolog [Pomacea canaliculata]